MDKTTLSIDEGTVILVAQVLKIERSSDALPMQDAKTLILKACRELADGST